MRNYLAASCILLWVINQKGLSGARNDETHSPLFNLLESPFVSYVANCPSNVDITVNKNKANQKTISGLACVTRNKNVDYQAFQGIPFAEPPVGDLRFRSPVQKTLIVLPDPYNAISPKSECISTVNKMPSIVNLTTATRGNEDCLYLNIFRPVTRKSKLPVVVWIHGGSFLFGNGNIPVADSEGFMENQVILVSINYRLSVFGFLCTEDEESPGNYGLKDQIAALQWIQDNIAAFGGDPKGVTVFGESAGGASIMYLIQSPKAAGLFQGAIIDSASSLCLWALSPDPLAIAKAVASQVGFHVNHHTKHIVDSLRKVDSVKLSRKAADVRTHSIIKGLPWAPCVDNDVVPGYSYNLLEKGTINKVPVLIGFNSQEARDTSASAKHSLSIKKKGSLAFPKHFVPVNLNITEKQTRAVAEQIIKEYEIDNSKGITAFTNFASEDLFVRAINRTVQLLSQYVPVYFYEMAYTGGDFFHDYTPEVPGVAHAEELQFLFNFVQDPNTDRYINSTIVSDLMLTLWTNFAKHSDPTPSPVNKVTWKRADSGGLQNLAYLYIDVEPKLLYGPRGKTMSFWNELYNKYQNGTRTTF